MINKQLVICFGSKIKQLRDNKNWSQEKLSFATGFHRTYIGMIERGERNISLINIAVFAKIFEISVSEILDFSSIDSKLTYQDYETKSEE